MVNRTDLEYQSLLSKILTDGKIRGDRTGTGTKSIFSHTLDIDMSEGFPLITTKKVFYKGIIHELLWFLNGDTNIRYLVKNDVNIWTSDAYKAYTKYAKTLEEPDYSVHVDDPNENIIRLLTIDEFKERILSDDDFSNRFGELGPIYGKQWVNYGHLYDEPIAWEYGAPTHFKAVGVNQIQNALNLLRDNPESRRIIVSAWNVVDIPKMTLPPCFIKGSLIKTFDGEYIPIEKIRKGDLVLTEDGSYNEVYELMETDVYDTDLVSFRYCGSPYPIKSTDNHPFLIKDKGFIEAKDICNGDYVSIPIPQIEEDFTINYNLKQNQYSSKEYEEIIDDEREWYLMGYFLGDGWLNSKGEVLLSINDKQFNHINSKIGGVVPLNKLSDSGENVKKYCFKQKKNGK